MSVFRGQRFPSHIPTQPLLSELSEPDRYADIKGIYILSREEGMIEHIQHLVASWTVCHRVSRFACDKRSVFIGN